MLAPSLGSARESHPSDRGETLRSAGDTPWRPGPRMYYSAYRRALVVGWIALTAAFGLVGLLVSVGLAIAFVVALALTGALVLPLQFWLLRGRLDDHDGRFPMPALGLGMYGVDVIDDRTPSADHVRPVHVVCPNCHSLQSTRSGKFCHECGAPLASPATTPAATG